MITGLGITSANMRSTVIKDTNGKVVARYTRSPKSGASKKKPKKLLYNMRQISSRILKSKTSGAARMALTGARSKVAQLKRQVNDGEYDETELMHAILHAMQITRVAKKKMKHLQEEEAAKKGGVCSGAQADMEEDFEEQLADEMGKAGGCGSDIVQEVMQELQRDMQRKMQRAMQEEMQKLLEEAASESGLDELSEELIAAFSGDMDPDDLEAMKKKHRSEELKDILEADMKYLKAMFNRLQREKEANSSANSGSRSVSLELGGAEIPVETTAAPDMAVMTEGANIDCMA